MADRLQPANHRQQSWPEDRIGIVQQGTGAPENVTVHHYPRYSDPANRRDGEPIPEGLGAMEWLDRSNVDVPRHYFKGYLAVPWLTKQFKLPDPGQVYPPAPPEDAK